MAKKEMSFEESMARLEEIVRALESGEESLEQSLKWYEEGIALIRSCNAQLEKAEQKVKMLQMQSDGSVALVDAFADEEADV